MNRTEHNNITVYVGAVLETVPINFFFESIFGKQLRGVQKHLWNMFQGASGEASFDFLHITQDPERADFFLLPHDYYILEKTANLKVFWDLAALAEKYKKKILVFAMGDSDEHIDIPHSFIFRYSQYGYKKRENEIITPPYTFLFKAPVLDQYRAQTWGHVSLREKDKKPTVSFRGWADFSSFYRRITYGGRISLINIKKYIFRDARAELHKPGIYFRRKAVRMLKHSNALNTNFLMRKSFFAKSEIDGKTRIDSGVVEKEYVESIVRSDFVLAPKGMGNTSLRFFETLSLGRFPVLINTDYVFPLQGHIDYKKFVVIVDHERVKDIERAILDFYNPLSDEEFKKRQIMAREAFELLRPASFLNTTLLELKRAEEGYKRY